MADWKEALDRLDRAAIAGMDAEFVDDYTTIRAHIEGLEANIRSLSPLNYEERCRLRDAEARVRELEAWRDAVFDGPAVYDQLTEDAKRRTGPENVSDTLDAVARAAKLPAVRDGDSRVEAEGR